MWLLATDSPVIQAPFELNGVAWTFIGTVAAILAVIFVIQCSIALGKRLIRYFTGAVGPDLDPDNPHSGGYYEIQDITKETFGEDSSVKAFRWLEYDGEGNFVQDHLSYSGERIE